MPRGTTSDHGWNLTVYGEQIAPVIRKLQEHGIRVSLFIDPDPEQIRLARDLGAERVELYTEAYAAAYNTPTRGHVVERYAEAAHAAMRYGMELNAGHDLNLNNLGYFLHNVPGVLESRSVMHLYVNRLNVDYLKLFSAIKML